MTKPSPPPAATPRRVLATRNARWAVALARALGHVGVRPNAVSIAGIGFGVVAGAAFSCAANAPASARAGLLLAAAASIQLRLLCNLLDGMLAIEGGLKSKTGDIYNDLPDRLADIVILVGAGYAVRASVYGVALGWTAAIFAVLTAYVRVLAGSLGLKQHFIGPMAKQHRMFTLTVVTLAGAVEALFDSPPTAIYVGLIVIVAGSIVTVIRRTMRMASEMHAR
jgi:phosphatidylglycerophosphate synthase